MNMPRKHTLIVGFGASGLSTARYLSKVGVSFDIADHDIERVKSLAGEGSLPGNVVNLSEVTVVEDKWTAELFSRYECLVVSPGVSTRSIAFEQASDNGVEVIGDVELFARATTKPVIAVTGSNGKSTVVSMTGEILRAAGLNAAVVGNVGLPCLDGLNDDSVDVYVLELSSFQLETTSSLQPLVAAVLNISEDHMDRYDNLEDYAFVKRSVYRNATIAVANADDQRTLPAIDPRQKISLFSTHGDSSAWFIQQTDTELFLRGPEGFSVDSSVLCVDGGHNISNALVSVALVYSALGASTCLSVDRQHDKLKPVFAAGLGNFKGLPHRTELVRQANGVSWFNDSKGTNVGACVSAIEGMNGPVVLIAGGRGKDADFSPLNQAIANNCRAVVLIGEDAPKIKLAIGNSVPVFMENSLTEAVNRASRVAQAGDTVLLSPACASFDMFSNFEARGNAFAEEVNRLCA